jgi:hypothetical protein
LADRKIAGVGAIPDQEMVLEQKGLRNEGTDAARFEQLGKSAAAGCACGGSSFGAGREVLDFSVPFNHF